MKTIYNTTFYKSLFCISLISSLFTSNPLAMETTDRNPLNGHAAGAIVRHFQNNISYDTYRKAMGDKIALISVNAAEGLGSNYNLLKATTKATAAAQKVDSTKVEVNLPQIDSQTIYLGQHIGHVTINTFAASFSLANNAADPKDYYHVILEGIYYPAQDVISGKHRVVGLSIGAEPSRIEETDTVAANPVVQHNLDKLSILKTSPETTIGKTTYTSQVSLGFNLGLSVAATASGPTATPSIGFNFSTNHGKSFDISDLNIRNTSGLSGRNLQWQFEAANAAKSIHETSPTSRSSLHAYTQGVWAIDYSAATNPATPLAHTNTERRLAFVPYVEVAWEKVTKSLFGKTKHHKKPNVAYDGGEIVMKLDPTPLNPPTTLQAAPVAAPAPALLGALAVPPPAIAPVPHSLFVSHFSVS